MLGFSELQNFRQYQTGLLQLVRINFTCHFYRFTKSGSRFKTVTEFTVAALLGYCSHDLHVLSYLLAEHHSDLIPSTILNDIFIKVLRNKNIDAPTALRFIMIDISFWHDGIVEHLLCKVFVLRGSFGACHSSWRFFKNWQTGADLKDGITWDLRTSEVGKFSLWDPLTFMILKISKVSYVEI